MRWPYCLNSSPPRCRLFLFMRAFFVFTPPTHPFNFHPQGCDRSAVTRGLHTRLDYEFRYGVDWITYSDRDKSWPICCVISNGKSDKTYPGHVGAGGEEFGFSKIEWKSHRIHYFSLTPPPQGWRTEDSGSAASQTRHFCCCNAWRNG